MKFTIGYIKHTPDALKEYLGPSVKKLKGDFDVIGIPSTFGCPAKIYNEILKQATNRYIIFTHEDIRFKDNMLEQVEKTINEVKNFGVLALVGKIDGGQQVWSNGKYLHKYRTVDCCFFVADKANNIFFDDVTFDGLHKYGEDYAMQCRAKGLINYSIYTASSQKNKDIGHYSYTCKAEGFAWGNWPKYHGIFKKKWGRASV